MAKNYGNEHRRAGPVAPEKKPSNYQDVKDAKTRSDEEKAPTTGKEMGVPFKKGGFVRSADGIAQRGKTRGKMV